MTFLEEIRAQKERELAARESAHPLSQLIAACGQAPPVRRLSAALRATPPRQPEPGTGGPGVHAKESGARSTWDLGPGTLDSHDVRLIAEVKRRSPARGALRADADAAALAATYVAAGAAAVSVLTDEKFFAGADADLAATRARVAAPLLRKDFTISSYQIYEARALGADAVLLIAALLSDDLINVFLDTADCLGMDTIVEAHTEEEVRRAVAIRAPIIGINNRDLSTFRVDLGTTERLRTLIPKHTIVVSESGITTRSDVKRMAAAGAQAVLVGEALVTAKDPAAKVRELLGLAQRTGDRRQATGVRGQASHARALALAPRHPTPDPRPPTPDPSGAP